jgi:hypothetical protein
VPMIQRFTSKKTFVLPIQRRKASSAAGFAR